MRNRAGGGDDLRGGDIATENARLGATGPIDLLDTESAIAVRDDLAAPNAQLLVSPPRKSSPPTARLLDRSVSRSRLSAAGWPQRAK